MFVEVISRSRIKYFSPMAPGVAFNCQHDDPWSAIPSELLELILKRLDSISDYIKFGAVCKWWRSTQSKNQIVRNPLLLVPASDQDDPAACSLLDPSTSILYKIPPLPLGKNSKIVGSSLGWLVRYSITNNYDVELINPITRANIPLPPATEFDNFQSLLDGLPEVTFPVEYFFIKVVISSDPNHDSIVMVIHGNYGELGFCRVGDKTWTTFPSTKDYPHYHDVVYHKGQFYAVNQDGVVVACELDPVPNVVEVARLPPNWEFGMNYLVEASDEMLLVTRYRKVDGERRTSKFVIYRLSGSKCEEVTSFGDQIMFLGNSGSMCISTNKLCGCQPNRIYFVDDDAESYSDDGCFDMGVYDLKNNKIFEFYNPSKFMVWPMFWLTPTGALIWAEG